MEVATVFFTPSPQHPQTQFQPQGQMGFYSFPIHSTCPVYPQLLSTTPTSASLEDRTITRTPSSSPSPRLSMLSRISTLSEPMAEPTPKTLPTQGKTARSGNSNPSIIETLKSLSKKHFVDFCIKHSREIQENVIKKASSKQEWEVIIELITPFVVHMAGNHQMRFILLDLIQESPKNLLTPIIEVLIQHATTLALSRNTDLVYQRMIERDGLIDEDRLQTLVFNLREIVKIASSKYHHYIILAIFTRRDGIEAKRHLANNLISNLRDIKVPSSNEHLMLVLDKCIEFISSDFDLFNDLFLQLIFNPSNVIKDLCMNAILEQKEKFFQSQKAILTLQILEPHLSFWTNESISRFKTVTTIALAVQSLPIEERRFLKLLCP